MTDELCCNWSRIEMQCVLSFCAEWNFKVNRDMQLATLHIWLLPWLFQDKMVVISFGFLVDEELQRNPLSDLKQILLRQVLKYKVSQCGEPRKYCFCFSVVNNPFTAYQTPKHQTTTLPQSDEAQELE